MHVPSTLENININKTFNALSFMILYKHLFALSLANLWANISSSIFIARAWRLKSFALALARRKTKAFNFKREEKYLVYTLQLKLWTKIVV